MSQPFTLRVEKSDPRLVKTGGIVKSFFGSDFVRKKPGTTPENLTKEVSRNTSNLFMQRNKRPFKLNEINYKSSPILEGRFSRSVRYEQKHNGIPVYRSKMVVAQSKKDGAINLAINKFDYNIPKEITKSLSKFNSVQIKKLLIKRFGRIFKKVSFSRPKLYVYRHKANQGFNVENHPNINRLIHGLNSPRQVGSTYLVWRVFMDSYKPNSNLELLIDATNNKFIKIKDRRCYTTIKGKVFWPDPIRSSKNKDLNWSVDPNILKQECIDVDLENIDPPINGEYKLSGKWVKNIDFYDPEFDPPTTKTDFLKDPSDRVFLNVMVYYYVDRLAQFLHDTICQPKLNEELNKKPIRVDPQGSSGADAGSHFLVNIQNESEITFGEDKFSFPQGVPDSTDPGVIIHEYGHAIHHFIIGDHDNGPFEEGFCDFLSTCWLDRFNIKQFEREKVMLWQASDSIFKYFYELRRVDLDPRLYNFDTVNNYDYDLYFIGDIHASALWQIYLNFGGKSPDPKTRQDAADQIIKLYIEMLAAIQDNNPLRDIVNGLAQAHEMMEGDKQEILDPYNARGDWEHLEF